MGQIFWSPFHNSLAEKPGITTTKSTGEIATGKINKTDKKTVYQVGDSRFLDGIYKCIERRCRLLGLDAPFRAVFTREYDPRAIRAIVTDLDQPQRDLLTQAILEGKDPVDFAERLKNGTVAQA